MKKKLESSRRYEVISVINGTREIFTLKINDFTKNDNSEVMYALEEIFDDILDLQLNEARYFHPNRDDLTTRGIIVRLK